MVELISNARRDPQHACLSLFGGPDRWLEQCGCAGPDQDINLCHLGHLPQHVGQERLPPGVLAAEGEKRRETPAADCDPLPGGKERVAKIGEVLIAVDQRGQTIVAARRETAAKPALILPGWWQWRKVIVLVALDPGPASMQRSGKPAQGREEQRAHGSERLGGVSAPMHPRAYHSRLVLHAAGGLCPLPLREPLEACYRCQAKESHSGPCELSISVTFLTCPSVVVMTGR
jgi:hypothetical protein